VAAQKNNNKLKIFALVFKKPLQAEKIPRYI
jgi:hypothetical protein